MKVKFLFVLAFCFVAISGCYTATIETGRWPSIKVIEENWAACWLAGLIPPKTVEIAGRCPHGVAKVMTQHSFLNMLVMSFTFSIYTPMTIQVTCAAPSETSLVDPEDAFAISRDASSEEFRNVFFLAAEKVAQSENEVFVLIQDENQGEPTKQEDDAE